MKKTVKAVSTELEPVSSRKSFYRKAHVLDDGKGTRYLKSYDTVMCSVDGKGVVRRYGDWVSPRTGRRSATTAAHLRSFFATYGVKLKTRDFYALPETPAPELVQKV